MKETESTLSNIVDPRFNDELYGFDKIEKMFLNVIRNEKLSNAYIFYGIKGVGKATFAFRLARFILNEDKKFDNKLFISKDNKIFKSVSSLNHPDFILINGNNGVTKTISVDLLKTIQSSTYKTSIESKYKVIIIDSIDDITKSSSTNTLLKSLEDAPRNCIFLIIAHSISKVPKTIQSRCQKIYFNPVNNEKFKNWFIQSKFIDDKNADTILGLSNGSLGKAIEIINTKNFICICDQVDEIVKKIEEIDNDDIEKLFLMYADNEINIENFLLIIQFQISKHIKGLIEKNHEINFLESYLSLFFEINKTFNFYKLYSLEPNQLLNKIKSCLLQYSKKYN